METAASLFPRPVIPPWHGLACQLLSIQPGEESRGKLGKLEICALIRNKTAVHIFQNPLPSCLNYENYIHIYFVLFRLPLSHDHYYHSKIIIKISKIRQVSYCLMSKGHCKVHLYLYYLENNILPL